MTEITPIATDVDVDTARWFGDAEIPFLKPYGLNVVPGYRETPDGDEDETWRDDYFVWRDLAYELREKIHKRNTHDRAFRERERIKAYACPHYFKAIYCWLTEPRVRRGEEMEKPFIPFHFQVHLTNARLALLRDPDPGDFWSPKARGLGVSWNNQCDETWTWLATPYRWILASRNENLVADLDNVDAMFGKVFYELRHLPGFLLPAGFDPYNPRKWWNSSRLLLTNHDRDSPGYGSQLVGSPTTRNIGRAGRYTGADIDEAQKIPKLNAVIQSLRGSSDHIFLTGTEGTEEGEEWAEGWMGAKRETPENVLELNYPQNPYQSKLWLAGQYARATTEAQKASLALEYERNYFAGYGDWIYPEARHIPQDDLPYRKDVALDTTFDPGKDDETAVLVAQQTMRDGVPGFHVLFTYEAKLTNMEWVCHVFTGIWPEAGKDSCFGIKPTPEEQHIGDFYYKNWLEGREMRWFVDPAAKASQTNHSFWTMFRDKTEELRQREFHKWHKLRQEAEERGQTQGPLPNVDPWGISLQLLAIEQNRMHNQRHYALRKYLPAVTIQQGVPSAARFKKCLTNYQYNPRSPKAVTEAVPLHNQYSHLASCAEYYAIYYHFGFVDPPPIRPKQGPGSFKIPTGLANRLPKAPARPPDIGKRHPPTSPTGRWR